MVTKARPFSNRNIWAMAEDFLGRVSLVWQDRIQGTPMFRVISKLKVSLKDLNREKL